MTIKEEIENQYYSILELSKKYDECFKEEDKGGWSKFVLIKNKKKDFDKYKEKLEYDIPKFMQLIRESIEEISEDKKEYVIRTETDPNYGGEYTFKDYENIHFSSLISFFHEIRRTFEDKVLQSINGNGRIYNNIRAIKTDVLSLSHILTLFVPEKMITIQQQVKIVFDLRDKGLDDIALKLEEIDNEKDALKKCLTARTALENFIVKYLENKNLETKPSFFTNLDTAKKNGLIQKTRRKAIGSHYSFVSKIVHGDISPEKKNAQYAVDGVLNIIGSLI